LLTDFANDSSIDKESRKVARATIKSFKTCAAYQEIAWLDKNQLKKYISEFRANGYQPVAGYKWIENRENNRYAQA